MKAGSFPISNVREAHTLFFLPLSRKEANALS